MSSMTPQEIVSELDRHIVGQNAAKRAVALALRMLPLADGSDYGGSLRNPAGFCGIVGFRPSPGRVPSGPTWSPLSVSGPMARSEPRGRSNPCQ